MLGFHNCLLYTSDAADDLLCVDLGGRRIIKKKIIEYTLNNMRESKLNIINKHIGTVIVRRSAT